MGTEDDWAAEEYQQQRRRGWCPVIVAGVLIVAVTGWALLRVAVDRVFR